jgi:hypothetical protein
MVALSRSRRRHRRVSDGRTENVLQKSPRAQTRRRTTLLQRSPRAKKAAHTVSEEPARPEGDALKCRERLVASDPKNGRCKAEPRTTGSVK